MESIEQLLLAKPALKELFNRMNHAQIRWAIFAGSEVALLTANRTPTDLDIIVHNDDFEKLAAILPAAKRLDDAPFLVVASDSEQLKNIASTLTLTLDDTEIDIMSRSRFETNEGTFPIYLTDLTCQYRLQFEVGTTMVFLANSFDTILIKAFMRRGEEQGKFDETDVQALSAAIDINKGYMTKRIAETGLSVGARQFLRRQALL